LSHEFESHTLRL